MDLEEVGCRGTDWMELIRYRDRLLALVIAVMNLRVPENAMNYLTSRKTVNFSRRSK
jgi:hypothetical protein